MIGVFLKNGYLKYKKKKVLVLNFFWEVCAKINMNFYTS